MAWVTPVQVDFKTKRGDQIVLHFSSYNLEFLNAVHHQQNKKPSNRKAWDQVWTGNQVDLTFHFYVIYLDNGSHIVKLPLWGLFV